MVQFTTTVVYKDGNWLQIPCNVIGMANTRTKYFTTKKVNSRSVDLIFGATRDYKVHVDGRGNIPAAIWSDTISGDIVTFSAKPITDGVRLTRKN